MFANILRFLELYCSPHSNASYSFRLLDICDALYTWYGLLQLKLCFQTFCLSHEDEGNDTENTDLRAFLRPECQRRGNNFFFDISLLSTTRRIIRIDCRHKVNICVNWQDDMRFVPNQKHFSFSSLLSFNSTDFCRVAFSMNWHEDSFSCTFFFSGCIWFNDIFRHKHIIPNKHTASHIYIYVKQIEMVLGLRNENSVNSMNSPSIALIIQMAKWLLVEMRANNQSRLCML